MTQINVLVESAREEDLPGIQELLTRAGLPVEGTEEHWQHFQIVRSGNRLIGCAGIEVYGQDSVVRSLAVEHGERGRGLGRRLMLAIFDRARAAGCTDAYGLTLTAERMMGHLGFEVMRREEVPASVLASREFSTDICAGATVIHRRL